MMTHPSIAIALVLLLSSVPAAAEDGGPAESDPWPRAGQLYLSGGLAVGHSLQEGADNGLVIGGETSVSYWTTRLIWTGLYLDGVYDYGAEAFRLSVGPQVGVGPVGVDFGYLYEDRIGARHGFSLRLLLTIGIVALYGRWGHLPEQDRSLFEIGLLLKYPVRLIPKAPRRIL